MAFFSRSDDLAPYEEEPPAESFLPAPWAEALRRRAAELIGLALLALAAALAAALASYDPADPSFFNATSDAPRNWLGLTGATLADPLARTLGLAAWTPALVLGVWAFRLILHRGEERAWSRLALSPLAVPIVAAALSAHVPPDGWPHPYGLGGLVGDGAGRELFALSPWPPALAAPLLTVGLVAASLLASGWALGLDRSETGSLVRWLGGSLAEATGLALRLLRRGGAALMRAVTPPRSERLGRPDPVGMRRRAATAAEPDAEAETEAEEPPLTARAPARAETGAGIDAEDEAGDAPRERAETLLGRIRAAARREAEPEAEPSPEPDPDAPRAAVAPPARVAVSRRARAEREPTLALAGFEETAGWQRPPLTLLQNPREIVRPALSTDALEENARMLEAVLDDYGIRGEIVKVSPGPVVTMYELEPERGVKASRVIGLADDIARSMSALSARVSTVPGRSIIGIELPNETREKVVLREIFEARAFGDAKEKLLLALGKDIAGAPVVANLARMPHLLIAGTTGSGKSVAINTMILSLLYRLSPEECRLIMIDPKMLELSVYDGIPHLLSPVVTDPKKAVVALKWVVAEMEERYRKMSRMGVRNIEGYNARVRDALAKGEDFTRTVQTGFCEDTGEPVFETQSFAPEELPFIVVVVDEMADLMMVAGKEIEACIQRLAQMARASGIHLIMATQRPSVDVITGTIKANFPTRISFQVTSKIDSRTILGEQGAEQLLGMGDMLHMAGGGRVSRVHGPFVSDEEVEEVVGHLKALGEPSYVSGVTDGPDEETSADIDVVLGLGDDGSEEALYDRAVAIVARDRKCSTSYIQRKLSIGYQRAARLVEQMEDQGVVSPANKVGKREILVGEA
ncbi:MAG TPA: DNA translocase FtsK 4TM domain-containing protein [Paracoccaceae bacterium]|nr:DNA translocase FtsK 4TM domain-containing protein [Paracoccaceae bacterium]